MENRELQFLIMIDLELPMDRLLPQVVALLDGAKRVRTKSFDWNGNWCQISENGRFDQQGAEDADEGYLYYRYKIEVSPNASVRLEDQIQSAMTLKDTLKSIDARAEICADFEDLLP
jgi:hypothetical protein